MFKFELFMYTILTFIVAILLSIVNHFMSFETFVIIGFTVTICAVFSTRYRKEK